ncbi:hypothetical protein HIC20_01040 [Buchnera aphidicola (Hormaphis cornu)]|nr:hypothetical protein HIC20_01040 [Buchnera aphidicola (Hormaphis cornu)]
MKKKIISDTKSLYLNAITDFWRKFCYTLPKNIIQIIFQHWKEPKALLLVILPLLQKTKKIKNLNKFSKIKFIHYHNQLILKIKIFKKKMDI